MATNTQLFESLTALLARHFESREDIALEKQKELKERTIELINEDRRN